MLFTCTLHEIKSLFEIERVVKELHKDGFLFCTDLIVFIIRPIISTYHSLKNI